MTADEALDIVEQILPPGTITPVKALIFREAWCGQEYGAIAKTFGYDTVYIRDSGAQLWRSLTHALSEPVKKKNFRTLLQQRLSYHPLTIRRDIPQPEATYLQLPEFPGDPLPLHSKFYVERASLEAKLLLEINKPGSLVRIKAPHKMGKSSLLIRMTAQLAMRGDRVVNINFKQADPEVFSDLTKFLRWFCTNISHQLGFESKLDEYWNSDIGSKASCTIYLTHYLLKQITAPLVLVLNEFDQVLEHAALAQDVLLLLQSWHEEGKQVEVLQNLRLVLIHSINLDTALTFNQVILNSNGLLIELPELDVQQTQALAHRYGLKWMSSSAIQKLMDLVGGHPYLIQLALYHLWSTSISLEQLLQDAATSSGIYGNHLRSYLAILRSHPTLEATYRQIISANENIYLDPIAVYKLESLGLITVKGHRYKATCKLYQLYFYTQLADRFSQARMKHDVA
jgi:hypothetical protein